MTKRDPLLALIFVLFLAILWLGFLFHQDQRFAGSLAGGVLAISGSLLLFIPLIYSIIKRVPSLKAAAVKKISFPTMLTIHVYAGFIGAILVLLHTGHKFNGLIATLLTVLLLIVVFSGYIGRYLLNRNSTELTEKKLLLAALESQYATKVVELHSRPDEKDSLRLFSGFFSRLFAYSKPTHATDVLRLADSIADLEYAISSHDLFKRLFSAWLKLHIVLSLIFYLLLVLHIGGEYYFGLRWFA